MELLNPKLTIENTTEHYWLVRLEHEVSDVEHLDIRLKVHRAPAMPVAELPRQVMRQALALMQVMLDNRGPDSASAGSDPPAA